MGLRRYFVHFANVRFGFVIPTLQLLVRAFVLALVFFFILGGEDDLYVLHVLLGVTLWGFISKSLTDGATSFESNKNLLLAFGVSRISASFSAVFSNALQSLPAVAIVWVLWVATARRPPSLPMIMQTVLGVILLVAVVSLASHLLALVTARWKGFHPLFLTFMQVAFYGTPILWELERLPESMAFYVTWLNPFTLLLKVLRHPMAGIPLDWDFYLVLIGYSFLLLVATYVANRTYFDRWTGYS